MWIVKNVLKVFALPVLLILGLIRLFGVMAVNASGMVISLFMLLVFLYGIFCAFQKEWLCVGILVAVEGVCFIFEFGVIWLMTKVECANDKMVEFMHS